MEKEEISTSVCGRYVSWLSIRIFHIFPSHWTFDAIKHCNRFQFESVSFLYISHLFCSILWTESFYFFHCREGLRISKVSLPCAAHLFREKEANEQSWITSFFWRGWKPICNPFLLTVQCMEMATKVKENWMKKHTAKGCLCIGHDMKLSQYVCVCVCVLFLSVYFLFIRSLDS